MNYAEALSGAITWMNNAEYGIGGMSEERMLALSEGWLKVAAEIRQSMALTSEQVDRQVAFPSVQE